MVSNWIRRTFIRSVVVICATLTVGLTTSIPAQAAFPIGGAILTEYNAVGGFGFFGESTSPESPAEDDGRYQTFAKGHSIYWKSSVANGKANQIGGLIRDKFRDLDWERSFLGFPTTREQNGRKPGRFNLFEGGGIYWSSGAPRAYAIDFDSEIWKTWAASDYENGIYGYPTSDEYDFQGGRKQDFQFGKSIVWQPEGFPQDYAGDGETDFAADCEQNATCGLDARGRGIAPQDLPTQTPRDRTIPIPGGRAAQDPCSIPAPADADSPTAAEVTPAPTTPTTETTVAPSSSSPTSASPEQGGSTPADSSTVTPSAPPAETPAAPIPSDSQPVTTPPALEQGGSVVWCREEGTPGQAPTSANRAPDTSMCSSRQDKWWGTRDNSCFLDSNAAFIARNSKTLKEVGRIEGRESMSVNLTGWNSTEFTAKYSFSPTRIVNFLTASLSVRTDCAIVATGSDGLGPGSGLCDGLGQQTGTAFLTPNVTFNTESTFSVPVGAGGSGVIKFGQIRFNLRVIATLPPNLGPSPAPLEQPVQTSRVRCDSGPNVRNYTGCVIGDTIPVWDLTGEPELDEYRRHVSLAHQSGALGAADLVGGGDPLTRITNTTQIKSNRRATCGKVTGDRPVGKSCDEYPMAATEQGGAGNTRTFPLCDVPQTPAGYLPSRQLLPEPVENIGPGASVCLIDASENSRAGSLQTWFFTKSRILDGDKFLVRVY